MNKIQYIGHSAFYIKKDAYGILIDPFITSNPVAKFDYRKENITHIIVTHAHLDHLGDAIPIAKATGAEIIAIFELANYCASMGAKAVGIGIGGELTYGWGTLKFFPAIHSSSNPGLPYGGLAASVMLDIDGTRIYHAGDTSLTTEFQLIGEQCNPYYALLPVGGHYTMGIQDAAIAAKMLYAMEVIPMHYNTFDAIRVNIQDFEVLLEAQGQKCQSLKPNGFVEF